MLYTDVKVLCPMCNGEMLVLKHTVYNEETERDVTRLKLCCTCCNHRVTKYYSTKTFMHRLNEHRSKA